MSGLDSTSGIVALAALALALVGLVLAAVLFARLRELRAAQRVVLGDGESRDLVAQARQLERRVGALDERGQADAASLAERLTAAERRLDRSLSHSAVIRYDSYGEMSGRQSSSIALLDDQADGVLVSSILHREQARVYAKQVNAGDSELGISPEEREAIDAAMSARGDSSPAPRN